MMAFKLVDEKKTVQKVQQVSYCRLSGIFLFKFNGVDTDQICISFASCSSNTVEAQMDR